MAYGELRFNEQGVRIREFGIIEKEQYEYYIMMLRTDLTMENSSLILILIEEALDFIFSPKINSRLPFFVHKWAADLANNVKHFTGFQSSKFRYSLTNESLDHSVQRNKEINPKTPIL